ncbi:MAG: recombinase family protein [Proteobacteria bacterium]|nr:recombinase family protein [Pseudomonadota bacterium]
MKAVEYTRVSTETQVREGQGLKVQKEQIEKYCKAHKLELVGIYEDRGISGAKADEENLTIDREGLQNMLADIPSMGVKYVVVLNTSRLWRSDLVKILIQRELRKHDVDVKAIDQPTYSIYSQDDPSQFLINGMMELLDQYQRLEIALRLKRGRMNKAKNGGFAGGQRALGYKHIIVDNKPDITIDKKEAQTVSMIRNLRRRGLSMKAIADHLNDNQVPTKRGGNWYASTVQYILNNKLYKGLFEYNSISTERLDLVIQ